MEARKREHAFASGGLAARAGAQHGQQAARAAGGEGEQEKRRVREPGEAGECQREGREGCVAPGSQLCRCSLAAAVEQRVNRLVRLTWQRQADGQAESALS